MQSIRGKIDRQIIRDRVRDEYLGPRSGCMVDRMRRPRTFAIVLGLGFSLSLGSSANPGSALAAAGQTPPASAPPSPSTSASPASPQTATPAPAPSARPSAYVVTWPASKEFHDPSCPLLKDAKDVALMKRSEATGRGLTQHAACDPARARAGAADAGGPVYVYVSKSSTKYHRANCRELGTGARRVVLDADAVRGRWPCTVCKPPKRSSPPRI